MKLLILNAVAEFENEVKQILKEAGVKTFSHLEIKGYRDATEDAIETNWFGTEMNENESRLFYAFTPTENADWVCKSVNKFNEKQETLSHIHVAILTIEKFI